MYQIDMRGGRGARGSKNRSPGQTWFTTPDQLYLIILTCRRRTASSVRLLISRLVWRTTIPRRTSVSPAPSSTLPQPVDLVHHVQFGISWGSPHGRTLTQGLKYWVGLRRHFDNVLSLYSKFHWIKFRHIFSLGLYLINRFVSRTNVQYYSFVSLDRALIAFIFQKLWNKFFLPSPPPPLGFISEKLKFRGLSQFLAMRD